MNVSIGNRYKMLLIMGIVWGSVLLAFSIILVYAVDQYICLLLLPISFGIFSTLFNNVYRLMLKSVTVTLLIGLMYLKNIIIPVLMGLGNGEFNAYIDTSPQILPAIGLEIYEEFVVFLILFLKHRSLLREVVLPATSSYMMDKKKVYYLSSISFILLLYSIGCLFIYPQLAAYFLTGTIGDFDKSIQWAKMRIIMREQVPVLVYYTYSWCVLILRWIIPATVIFRLYISSISERKKIILSYVPIVISVLFVTDTVAVSVFIAIAFVFLLSKIYPSQSRKILVISLSSVIVIGIVFLVKKSFGEINLGWDAITRLANMLQAYFSGPDNVAVALNIKTPVSLAEIGGDILGFIPYFMYFFKELPTSEAVFNQTYFGHTEEVTQIIPMIAQGARHFSVFLAPIYTGLITNIAIWWETKSVKKNLLLDYAICVIGCVCLSMSVAMYSASLCFSFYLGNILAFQCIAYLVKKIT